MVGVHIRRGESYKEWENGRNYYADDVYLKYMSQLEKELESLYSRNVIFFIFSNDNTGIEEKGNICVSRNPWYIDQYLMSRCDYLMGPPSTFTMWSSYVGKTR